MKPVQLKVKQSEVISIKESADFLFAALQPKPDASSELAMCGILKPQQPRLPKHRSFAYSLQLASFFHNSFHCASKSPPLHTDRFTVSKLHPAPSVQTRLSLGNCRLPLPLAVAVDEGQATQCAKLPARRQSRLRAGRCGHVRGRRVEVARQQLQQGLV